MSAVAALGVALILRRRL
ncbi:MAG: hypothetical protein MK205_01845 [Candidatus Poseidoniia archaeon]|nr:hypothetical protein [Candidatus Poseidoniia archaeon]